MLSVHELRKGNATIPEEAREFIQNDIAIKARQRMRGRMALMDAVRPINDVGVTDYIHYQLDEMSRAQMVMDWGQGQADDIINLTRSVTKVPIITKSAIIPRRAFESAKRRNDFDLVNTTAEALSYRVAREENLLILQGWERDPDTQTFDILGLFQGATSSGSGSTWGTSTNILPSISSVLGSLRGNDIDGPYQMVLNSDELTNLQVSDPTSGLDYVDRISKILSGTGTVMDNIRSDNDITAGTALVFEPSTQFMALIEAAPMQVEVAPINNKTMSPIEVEVWEAVSFVFAHRPAAAQLTGIA